jgi:predicted secreted protein with PEFG-CTERM motif
MQRLPTSRFLAYGLILTLVGSLFSVVLPASQQSYASHENITVNIGIDDVVDTYESNDEVAIEGVIADEVDNENVIIRIMEPDGSTDETANFGEPGSGGIFDHLYEIPNNAQEGVWTVEAEYDDESAFTYFRVDDDADTVILVLDDHEDGIYEAGDEVTILGQVDEPDDSEENVLITVLDPLNDEIYDEEEVELDDDEFEFSFDLDNDASHGRYAIVVFYEFDDQEGSILFEIEDDDEGSSNDDEDPAEDAVTEDSDGDLSAEIPEESYEQNDSVVITGVIEDYDVDDEEELSISIRDPDDLEIDADDDVSVDDDETDGTFEYEYDISDDAEEGLYTITIQYNNDEVVLAFAVEEASSSGGGSDDGVTSGITEGDLTVRLNKASYLAGETMTVSGTVDDLQEDEEGNPEQVSIIIYQPGGQFESIKYVEPDEDNGDFSTTIVLSSDLDVDDDYWARASYSTDSVDLFFDITGVSNTPSDEITIETDSEEYTIGQTVEISGDVPDTMIVSGEPALIRINTPDGDPCRIDQFSVPSSGAYSYEIVMGGECGAAGEYEVELTYGSEEARTSFELIGSSIAEYDLNVDGDTYPIEYELSGGSINSMFVRPTENKLVVTVDSDGSGQLTLTLPREVIDAVEEGEDIAYIVTIEDESGNITTIEVEESENTDDARTLVIDYPSGTGRIEIAGTQVVPEFGAIAGIIMALAIVGIILATARYNKLNFFRQ